MRKRLPTAVILLGLLFLLIQYGSPIILFLALQGIVLAALLEFYNLARKKKLHPQSLLGVGLALFFGLSFFFRRTLPFELTLFGAFLVTGVYFLVSVRRLEQLPYFSQSIAITFFGALFVSFPLNYLYLIRLEKGPLYVYFLGAVIFLGDTGAYFVGKTVGRHKMAPLASPHKTWEGSAAGIVLAVLGALAARRLLLPGVEVGRALACGALVHAMAQVADPLESLFKRAVGVKDSSNLLPGHGGALDRIDSFLLAAPCFYYFILYFWK
jgi:phosphatidate cytidylyltransferase